MVALAGILLFSPIHAMVCQTRGGALFVVTEPLGALVEMDGRLIEAQTPILVRDLAPGSYSLLVRKRGYEPLRATVTMESGEAEAIELRLSPEVGSRQTPEQERNLAMLRVATVVLSVVAVGSTVNDIVQSSSSGGVPISPITVTAWGGAAGLFAFERIEVREKRRRESATLQAEIRAPAEEVLQESYQAAGELVAEERFAEALQAYADLAARHPETRVAARSYYQMARLSALTSEAETARMLYEIVVRNYPLPELYDRSLKSLADLHLAAGRYQESLEMLDKMVFMDPLYAPDEIRETMELIRSISREGGPDRG